MSEEHESLSHERPEDPGTEGEHLSSPEPGYPAEETQPLGGVREGAHEHPEDIDDTTPDKQTSP
jgi:hypothetical protein